jgi:hypothetical protein
MKMSFPQKLPSLEGGAGGGWKHGIITDVCLSPSPRWGREFFAYENGIDY